MQEYGSALQAASDRGYEKAVRIIGDKGAGLIAQGGKHGIYATMNATT